MSQPDDAARAARLAAALRENLKRRKAQSKGRAAPPAPAGAQDHAGDEARASSSVTAGSSEESGG
ncbi:hypothetical protein [Ancylobacter sp. SL191]|uniref:hypothetical protein n=1 Tax=Ancylobacter sp. SL191 TaxID=2995166 RepID=UPI00227070B9|nr:hypothetical protein [Ancylobacter sp. SL191]WAC27542.1 hypothetical protein OU996_00185 [Ancylobacter sp. SL191]